MKWQLRIRDVEGSLHTRAGRYWTLITPDGEDFAYWHPTCRGWAQAWGMISYLREHRGLT